MFSCSLHCHHWTNFSSHVKHCSTSVNTLALSPVHGSQQKLNCPIENSTTLLYRRRHSGNTRQAAQGGAFAKNLEVEGVGGGFQKYPEKETCVYAPYPKLRSRDNTDDILSIHYRLLVCVCAYVYWRHQNIPAKNTGMNVRQFGKITELTRPETRPQISEYVSNIEVPGHLSFYCSSSFLPSVQLWVKECGSSRLH
jgi:hypothetical protein